MPRFHVAKLVTENNHHLQVRWTCGAMFCKKIHKSKRLAYLHGAFLYMMAKLHSLTAWLSKKDAAI